MMRDESDVGERISYISYVFDSLVGDFVRHGRPMPAAVKRAKRYLDEFERTAMALERQPETPAEYDGSESIGTDEKAALEGVSRRTIQRNAEQLGGERVNGTWVFRGD
jgi:hypothetical protein